MTALLTYGLSVCWWSIIGLSGPLPDLLTVPSLVEQFLTLLISLAGDLFNSKEKKTFAWTISFCHEIALCLCHYGILHGRVVLSKTAPLRSSDLGVTNNHHRCISEAIEEIRSSDWNELRGGHFHALS